jgi:hypothetical protein
MSVSDAFKLSTAMRLQRETPQQHSEGKITRPIAVITL